MKTTDGPIDWRERLHTLPSGTKPALPVFTWIFRGFLCLLIFCVSSFFVIMAGGFFGLSRGIGPEQGGAALALYVLAGLIFNLVGAAVFAVIVRRSTSRTMARLVFYSFAAPAFIAVIFLAFLFARHYFW